MANNNVNKSNKKINNGKSKQGSSKKGTNGKNTSVKKLVEQPVKTNSNTNNENSFIMKTLVFLGVIVLGTILVYLMYHFFVKESDIMINMSTDKQIEYIKLEGQKELIITQKYVSDLDYTMRYDVNNFKVFKYKEQDIYKFINDERVLVVVEKALLPSSCSNTSSAYSNCYMKLDNYTEKYYITEKKQTYQITIKTPGTVEYQEGARARIDFMLKSFKIGAKI